MLKVTLVQEDEKAARLKLEGRIVGRWVNELRKECERYMDKGSELILDLSARAGVEHELCRGVMRNDPVEKGL